MRGNTCPSSKELTRSYSEGDEAMREHLEVCDHCADAWASFERIQALGKKLPDGLPSPRRAEEVRSALLAMAADSAPRQRSNFRSAWLYGAIAASIALLVGTYFLLSRGEETAQPAIAKEIHRAVVIPETGAEHEIIDAQPDELVRLSQGTINLEVKKLRAGERFRVVTRDAEVEVRGTAFSVTAKDDRLMSVSVASGRVEVRPAGYSMVVLNGGESWTRPEPKAPAPAPSDESLMEEEAIADEMAREPTGEEAHFGGSKRERAARSTTSRKLDKEPVEEKSERPGREVEPGPAEIAFNRGWEALRSGAPMRAADWFGRSIAAAGSNRIAEDASYWMAVAYGRAGAKGQAIEALRAFLASYPGSPRTGEASAMLGWKLFDKGDLDAAESLFRAALRDSVPRVKKSAEKGLGDIAERRSEQASE